ncbi:hypothetical protein GQ600_16562 [Phytophthora cactorum]|nr:hypothetical protein GQ600_16562 [Phytophthora cactorum]
MQGVDRLDQIRAKFSIADAIPTNHSWICACQRVLDSADGNRHFKRSRPHRTFVTELVSKLISGRCEMRQVTEEWRLAAVLPRNISHPHGTPPSTGLSMVAVPSQQTQIRAGGSESALSVVTKADTTVVTDYCLNHTVCLCRVVHGDVDTPFTCHQTSWTCWDKFHRFYLPSGLFNDKGNLRRSSTLAKLKEQHQSDTRPARDGQASQQSPSSEQRSPSQQSATSQQRQHSPLNQQSRVVRQIFNKHEYE